MSCGTFVSCCGPGSHPNQGSRKRALGKPNLCLFQGRVSIFRTSLACSMGQRNMNVVCVTLLGTGVSIPGAVPSLPASALAWLRPCPGDSVTVHVLCAYWRLLKSLALHHRCKEKAGQVGSRTAGNILLLMFKKQFSEMQK